MITNVDEFYPRTKITSRYSTCKIEGSSSTEGLVYAPYISVTITPEPVIFVEKNRFKPEPKTYLEKKLEHFSY